MSGNVYAKLNKARMMMQALNLKQTGRNDFAGFKYFELDVILPASNSICEEIGATTYTNFDKDNAYLYFVDTEKPEDKITFSLPMSTAALKGCHEVQNLGAVQTYLKRYLYQNCYELTEKDVLDKTFIPGDKKPYQKHENSPVAKSELAGGDTTPDERVKLTNLFNSKDANGKPVFTKEEIEAYKKSRVDKTAAILIGELEKEVKSRTSFNDDEIPFL